jgi:DNA-binding transcriptional LysR family regulator
MERGNQFEKLLLPVARRLATKFEDCTDDKENDSLARLRTAIPGTVLYQPLFDVPASFYEKHPALDVEGIRFTYFRPDFIRVDVDKTGVRRLFIIDAKVPARCSLVAPISERTRCVA